MTAGLSRTSAGVPSAIFLPNSSTTIRSVTPITRRISCSISRIVTPVSRIRRISASRSAFSAGLKPAAGSSRHSRAGLVASARAISSRRCSPYERLRLTSPARCAMPTKRSNSMEPSRPDRSSRPCRGSRNSALSTLVLWWASAPTMTFSSAVISGNSRTFWNVRAIPPRVISCFFLPTIDSPRKKIPPLVGRYTPVIALKQVVLPAPFGPISPKISPLRSEKLTLLRATTPPKRRVTSSTSSSASGSRSRGASADGSLPVGAARSTGRAFSASHSCGVPMCGSLNGSHLLLPVLELHRPAAARDQALRPEDHDHDDHHTEDREPEPEQVGVEEGVADAPQPVRNVREERTAQDRSRDVAGTPHPHAGQHQDRELQHERLRVDEALPAGEHPAGETADERADRERP